MAPKEEVATYAVGKAEGYLAEEKLNVDVINTDGSVAAVQAVASNSADIAPADAGAILAAREKGVPVRAIGGLVRNWPWRVAVQPGSEVRSPADLKGKKIGVISLASGSAIYARAYASDAGLVASRSPSPPTWRTRPDCPRSTCCTCRPARRSTRPRG
ncbi:hypothetical protein GCM10009654_23610 [Streptomyces hebeiensis]|uniref:SsuA/THI5-like domain-containing protein n=2 Tax=Streptomyces hebeiensis TaxID=229486 RepID=A0ABP4FBY1_9ACTN